MVSPFNDQVNRKNINKKYVMTSQVKPYSLSFWACGSPTIKTILDLNGELRVASGWKIKVPWGRGILNKVSYIRRGGAIEHIKCLMSMQSRESSKLREPSLTESEYRGPEYRVNAKHTAV